MSNGQLQGSQTELEQQEGQLPPATSPAGAEAAGANQDQAKMFGSSAQKDASLQKAAAPQQLSRQERLTKAPTAQAQDQGEAARAAADRMKSVGALGSRLDAKIEQYKSQIATSGTFTPSVNAQGLDAYLGPAASEDQRAAAQAALDKFATSGKTQADLKELSLTLGPEVLDDTARAALYEGVSGSYQAQQLDPANLTMEALGVFESDAELNQVAQELGISPEELAAYSPEQLDARVAEVEAQEFSEVESLQAELATAGPQRKQEIMTRLREMSQTGELTADEAVDSLQKQIDEGQEVEIGGQSLDLKSLLEDDVMSDVIREAASNEASLEALRETEPGLADWIDANKTAFKEFTQQAAASAQQLEGAQDEERTLRATLGETLSGLFLGDEALKTSEEWAAAQEELQKDSLYTAVQDSPTLANWLEQNPDRADVLRQSPGLAAELGDPESGLAPYLEGNPELIDQIKDFSQDELKDAVDATQTLANDPDGNIKMLTGLTSEGLLTDPNQIKDVELVVEKLSNVPASITADDRFDDLWKAGAFELEDLEDFANPTWGQSYYEDAVQAHKTREFLATNPTTNKLFQFVFGKKFGTKSINKLAGTNFSNEKPTKEGAKLLKLLDKVSPGLQAHLNSLDKEGKSKEKSPYIVNAMRELLEKESTLGSVDKFKKKKAGHTTIYEKLKAWGQTSQGPLTEPEFTKEDRRRKERKERNKARNRQEDAIETMKGIRGEIDAISSRKESLTSAIKKNTQQLAGANAAGRIALIQEIEKQQKLVAEINKEYEEKAKLLNHFDQISKGNA